jgi:hypothetical protein
MGDQTVFLLFTYICVSALSFIASYNLSMDVIRSEKGTELRKEFENHRLRFLLHDIAAGLFWFIYWPLMLVLYILKVLQEDE